LWGRLNGSYDAAAEVMPADTSLYIGFNTLAALPSELQWVTDSFSAIPSNPASPLAAHPGGLAAAALQPVQQTGIPGDLLGQIRDSTGISIPDDLYPWIGQYAGVGFISNEDHPEAWFVAIESHPFGKTDEFLQNLRRDLTNIQEMSFTTESVDGVPCTVQDVPEVEQKVAFCNTGRLVLIASNLDVIRLMLSAQGDRSLAQDAVYQQLAAIRPRDWSASIYLGREQVENSEMTNEIYNSLAELLGAGIMEAWNGSLLSAAIVPAGLRIDAFHALSPADLPETSSQILEALEAENTMLQQVPVNTMLYPPVPVLTRLMLRSSKATCSATLPAAPCSMS